MRFPRRAFAKGKLGRKNGMNGTEKRYADELQIRLLAGEIEWFLFEGVKLRLADNTFYTPDFFVMLPDGTLQAHEVKGTTRKTITSGERVERPFYEDDAKQKIKIAAAMFPLQFFLCFYSKERGWVKEEISHFEEAA